MEELYTRIEDYLDDHLDPAQRTAFEAELRTDPALAEALAQVREARESLARQWQHEDADSQLRVTLKRLGAQHFAAAGLTVEHAPARQVWLRKKWPIWAAAAASVAGLLIWLAWPPPDENQLYAAYRQFPEASFVTRSADTDQAERAAATAAFNRADYATALTALEHQAQTHPEDREIRLFAGLCQLELGRTREAAQTFAQIRATPGAWAGDATWYLALTFLKEKDRAQCVEILRQIGAGDGHYEEAQALLKKLGN